METFRPVPGYEGLYEVSDMGTVRSLPRKTLGRWGSTKTSPGRTLVPYKQESGYERLSLSKGGKSSGKLVHRLVAQAFLPPSEGRPYVNHIDRVRDNNKLSNLEWCTPKENSEHAALDGRLRRTHCKQGHEFTPDNIVQRADDERSCRKCAKDYKKLYQQEKRDKVNEYQKYWHRAYRKRQRAKLKLVNGGE